LSPDDQPQIRDNCREALEEAGHTVMVAADGQEGVRLYQREPVDLVILDLYMPKLDGLATIQVPRATTSHLPIIAMSGGGPIGQATSFLDDARAPGAVRTFEKPIRLDELLVCFGPAVSDQVAGWGGSGCRVGVEMTIARNPSTDPDVRHDRIRLLPQVSTPSRRRG
jgi:two-component system, response regulator, stage 0 sporulation protein F